MKKQTAYDLGSISTDLYEFQLSETQILGLLGCLPSLLEYVGSSEDPEGLLWKSLLKDGWKRMSDDGGGIPVWSKQIISSLDKHISPFHILGRDTIEECQFRRAHITSIYPGTTKHDNPMWTCVLNNLTNEEVYVFERDLGGEIGKMGFTQFFRRLSNEIGVDSLPLRNPIPVIVRRDDRAFWRIYMVLREYADDLL